MLILILATMIVAACSHDMSDLRQRLQQVKSLPPEPIPPLPEIKPYEVFIYEAEGLRDPFSGGLLQEAPDDSQVAQSSGGPQPDFDRRRELLESFSLDSLSMVGTLNFQGENYALVQDPDDIVHRVVPGNYLGRNHGEIVSISPTQIEILELVPNGVGGWIEREAAIALDEQL